MCRKECKDTWKNWQMVRFVSDSFVKNFLFIPIIYFHMPTCCMFSLCFSIRSCPIHWVIALWMSDRLYNVTNHFCRFQRGLPKRVQTSRRGKRQTIGTNRGGNYHPHQGYRRFISDWAGKFEGSKESMSYILYIRTGQFKSLYGTACILLLCMCPFSIC